MKQFNVNGTCYPDQHYMVDITERLAQIRSMIQHGEYFCINRGRQYGKTTTLSMLKQYLRPDYLVFSLSFEGLGEKDCQSAESFLATFIKLLKRKIRYSREEPIAEYTKATIMHYAKQDEISTTDFKNFISEICGEADRPVVLLVDEVDTAGNFTAFHVFLGILREMYLERRELPTFQSVILASVYDIKNLKSKIRPDEQHQYNSPWNIAADFTIDFSFSAKDIESMLKEYQQEHQTTMNTAQAAALLYDYTSGYPYLVCRLCKNIDEALALQANSSFSDKQSFWSKTGIQEAVKLLLQESNTLFDDMNKKLAEHKTLRAMLYDILYSGKTVMYNQYQQSIHIAMMFGFIKNDNGKLAVSNRIFEMWLYNLFVSEEQLENQIYHEGAKDKNQFVENGILNMKKILQRFVEHFTDIFGDRDDVFIEKEGRKYFLFYLKPIINGTGNYYIEARTRDERRTDVIIDYLGKQYIVELKIWHGNAYNERGEKQLLDYLNTYHVDVGYMLSFNFNQKKEVGVKEITLDGKTIIEAIV